MSQIVPPASTPAPSPTAAPTPAASRYVTVNAVNWQHVLEFSHLFRGFRLAINPAKVVIALLAILLIYAAGRAFDFCWGPQVFPNEIEAFQTDRPEAYRALRQTSIDSRRYSLQQLLETAAEGDKNVTLEQIDRLRDHPAAAFRYLRAAYERDFGNDLAEAHNRRVRAEGELKKNPAMQIGDSPAETERADRVAAANRLFGRVRAARETIGEGIFDTFLRYEIGQFDALIDNTLTFVRVTPVRTTSTVDIEGSAVSGGLLSKNPERLWQSDTVVGCLANMTITGPVWLFSATGPVQWRPAGAATSWRGWIEMISYRGVYIASLVLLAVFCLVLLAFAGASISRLSALEMAGVERAPLADVFRFSARRLWVFVKAPITPFLILLGFGVVIAAVALVGAIPFIGELILGLFFILFIAASFVLMLLLLGILGGFNLLYPTIAVEGSDAFDAMSRAFAYVYARPWRLLFFSVISLIYGVITILFVSFAVYLILLLTHTFVGWGTSLFGYVQGAHTGLSKLDTLWPMPQFAHLLTPTNWYAMSWTEYAGSLFLHFWVYLLITSIGAYVISYYFSAHTIIYLLLRRSVDGQSINEVFAEEEPRRGTASTPVPAGSQ